MADETSVLFVDDEAHILTSLKRLLRKESYRIFTADSGEAGLDILSENEIQMVVSDHRMPGMSGTQFLQKVKENYPDTIRAVLSGYAEASAIVDAINEGEVHRFIGKPWNDDDLKGTVRQGLEHFHILEENRELQKQSALQLEQLAQLNQSLEKSVEIRTRTLQLGQEVLESLPLVVLGISQEEEIVLTNGMARSCFGPLATMVPGTEIEDILPDVAVQAIRSYLTNTPIEEFTFEWEGRELQAKPAKLGDAGAPRGCVLLLRESSP
ncbi:MAG: response regulator [Gemmatimonadales bacterium]|nr:response regulator [Gemmatimonadales bacterium]